MVDCQCDYVPDGPIITPTEMICPACKGGVTFLSADEFESILRAAFLQQSIADIAKHAGLTES